MSLDTNNYVYTEREVFKAVTVAAGAVERSAGINLNTIVGNYLTRGKGNVCIFLTVTGSGVLTLEVEQSTNGIDFMTPSGISEVLVDFTSSSGPNSDGKDIRRVQLLPVPHLRFKATETGGVNALIITADITVQ